MKNFYDHLVAVEEVTTVLKNYNLSVDEHGEITQLVEKTIHHEVLNIILKKLPKEKHEDFLNKFRAAPHDKNLLDYLKREVGDIEEEIKKTAEKIKREILGEIKRATK